MNRNTMPETSPRRLAGIVLLGALFCPSTLTKMALALDEVIDVKPGGSHVSVKAEKVKKGQIQFTISRDASKNQHKHRRGWLTISTETGFVVECPVESEVRPGQVAYSFSMAGNCVQHSHFVLNEVVLDREGLPQVGAATVLRIRFADFIAKAPDAAAIPANPPSALNDLKQFPDAQQIAAQPTNPAPESLRTFAVPPELKSGWEVFEFPFDVIRRLDKLTELRDWMNANSKSNRTGVEGEASEAFPQIHPIEPDAGRVSHRSGPRGGAAAKGSRSQRTNSLRQVSAARSPDWRTTGGNVRSVQSDLRLVNPNKTRSRRDSRDA